MEEGTASTSIEPISTDFVYTPDIGSKLEEILQLDFSTIDHHAFV